MEGQDQLGHGCRSLGMVWCRRQRPGPCGEPVSILQQPPRYFKSYPTEITFCCRAMSLTFPVKSRTECDPYNFQVEQEATPLSFWYVPAFCTRPVNVYCPQYQLAEQTMVLYSSRLNRHLSPSILLLNARHLNTTWNFLALKCFCHKQKTYASLFFLRLGCVFRRTVELTRPRIRPAPARQGWIVPWLASAVIFRSHACATQSRKFVS